MDAFTRRIDPEDSFDVGDDTSTSFDLNASSVSSSSSSLSFGIQSPLGSGSDRDGEGGGGTDQRHPRGQPIDAEDQSQQSDYKHRRRPLYEAPEFVHRLNVFEEVDVGGTVTFECQVRAFPRPIIKWYKDDVEVPPTSSIDANVVNRVQAEDLTGTDSSTEGLLRLVIRDAHKEDEGAYRCKAENEEGVAATTGYLSVTGPAANQSGNGSQQPSPRINAVSTPPLLRAITEQQSMEEREAALYAESGNSYAVAEDDAIDEGADQSVSDVPILSTVGDWSTYAEYLQRVIDDDDSQVVVAGQQRMADNGSGSDTSCELEDVDDVKAVERDVGVGITNATPSLDKATKIADLETFKSDAITAIVDSDMSSSRGFNDDDDYVLTESTVNVVVVEGDNPDEETVAAAVIGLLPGTKDEAVNEAPMNTTRDEVPQVTEPRPPSAFVESTSAVVEGDDAGTSGPATVGPSSRTSEHAAVPHGYDNRRIDLVDIEPAAGGNSPLTDAEFQRQKSDAAVASDANRQLGETSAMLHYRPLNDVGETAPETAEDSGEVFIADIDDRRAAAGQKTPSSPDRPFKLGCLLRDIFPTSSKQEKAPLATDAPQQRSSTSEDGEVSKKLVETAATEAAVAVPSGERTAAVGGRRRVRPGVELTWLNTYEWYVGWFEMPWVVYVGLAVLFTLAAAATEADPAWVVIAVLATSLVAFPLFPLPTAPPNSV